ncbi:hypothetical protein ABZ114_23835 [Streptomyces albidoflavus]|uniref:hypothetical protein n=1 Tax=Streptomyces TaxID=1883 RepID=UPI000AE30EEF|nr:hypothetical protein [Streptomyces sp. KE1]
MTTPNVPAEEDRPVLRPSDTPEPAPTRPEPPAAPRYVRCLVLGCGRLHEITGSGPGTE